MRRRRIEWRPAREWGKDLLYVVVGIPVALVVAYCAWVIVKALAAVIFSVMSG